MLHTGEIKNSKVILKSLQQTVTMLTQERKSFEFNKENPYER